MSSISTGILHDAESRPGFPRSSVSLGVSDVIFEQPERLIYANWGAARDEVFPIDSQRRTRWNTTRFGSA